METTALVHDHLAAAPDHLRAPVLVNHGPHGLIEILAVLEERLPQDAFLLRADLPQRGVAAQVAQRGARLEAVDADRFERELDHELGAFLEDAGAPER